MGTNFYWRLRKRGVYWVNPLGERFRSDLDFGRFTEWAERRAHVFKLSSAGPGAQVVTWAACPRCVKNLARRKRGVVIVADHCEEEGTVPSYPVKKMTGKELLALLRKPGVSEDASMIGQEFS